MKDKILEKLKEIELQKGASVLYDKEASAVFYKFTTILYLPYNQNFKSIFFQIQLRKFFIKT